MVEKKLISVVVPVFNEEAMLGEVYSRTTEVMKGLTEYNYEIVFFDDGSTDSSREIIEGLCEKDEHIKAVFYSRNFGYSKSIYYAVREAKGDCVLLLHADLQNPPELIFDFVEKWEKGSDVVLGVKNKSRENPFMYFMRSVYYFIMRVLFGIKLVPHATEFELLDKCLVETIRRSEHSNPFLRGIILEYGRRFDYVYYTQDSRKKGKSKFNLSKYYDFMVCGVVNCSNRLPRRMMALSLICGVLAVIELFFNFIPDVAHGYIESPSNGLILRGIFLFCILLAVFISIIFEYIISIKAASDKEPLIVEEKRINY